MSDKLSDIAACPFCDDHDPEVAESSVPSALTGRQKLAVYCNACFCEGPTAESEADAIAAWNRRASPAPAIPAVDPVAIHDAALEAAATAVEAHDRDGREWINGSLWDTLTREACARIRALKAAPAISESEDAQDAARYRWLQRQRAHVWHEIADMPINRTNERIDAARKGEKS
ncbi:Lar family restriction alleviation protein [Burkholderia gladioli]|uniref:Lar family restriction alleviation protein n=1 Tax=Burkholderia gladioli TaxID=28095 RepID=UPI002654A40F|nr:Lar family restriction alleviation protein [Burkholderia gladioli]MDN7495039.1 Lar family restriction alleviation protein [Burkholderia gladioli]